MRNKRKKKRGGNSVSSNTSSSYCPGVLPACTLIAPKCLFLGITAFQVSVCCSASNMSNKLVLLKQACPSQMLPVPNSTLHWRSLLTYNSTFSIPLPHMKPFPFSHIFIPLPAPPLRFSLVLPALS